MEIAVAEAKSHLSELIRAVAEGEQVVITRSGKPVAQLVAPPTSTRVVRFGMMRGKIRMSPGWDDPISEEQFFRGDI